MTYRGHVVVKRLPYVYVYKDGECIMLAIFVNNATIPQVLKWIDEQHHD